MTPEHCAGSSPQVPCTSTKNSCPLTVTVNSNREVSLCSVMVFLFPLTFMNSFWCNKSNQVFVKLISFSWVFFLAVLLSLLPKAKVGARITDQNYTYFLEISGSEIWGLDCSCSSTNLLTLSKSANLLVFSLIPYFIKWKA